MGSVTGDADDDGPLMHPLASAEVMPAASASIVQTMTFFMTLLHLDNCEVTNASRVVAVLSLGICAPT
jgi:hypothetical protein